MYLRWRFAQFFELLWWRLYLRRKEKPAYLAWKKAYWERFLERAGNKPQPGSAVLDAGCGPAGIFMALPHCRVDAVDPLLRRYAASLPHFDPQDYPQVRFLEQTLESFLPEQPYSTVFCLNAINHVANLPLALDRLSSLTQAGGRLWVSVDAHRWSGLKALFRCIPGDILHPHQHSLEEYEKMLLNRGLVLDAPLLIAPGLIFNYYLLMAQQPDGLTRP
ncbi:MAG: class I SAM-dependent methyltransferase [Saprospiraceae bacterium]|nr:class I SAM-dependent methyltransferase [Saprospiraceae bacterium]